MASTELEKPHWLHPLSLVFELAARIRSQLIPSILAVLSATQGGTIGFGIAIVFFAISMAFSVFRYLTLRYQIKGEDLVIDEGILFRRHRTLPTKRIQNLDLLQTPFHRFFRVAEVRIETAAGAEPEATLRVLALADIEKLRAGIRQQSQLESPTDSDQSTNLDSHEAVAGASVTPLSDGAELILTLSTGLLAKAGLTSTKGIVIGSIIFGFLFRADGWENWDENQLLSYLGTYFHNFGEIRGKIDSYGPIAWVVLAILSICAAGILLKLFSVVWYVFTFYNYKLSLRGNDFLIQCGLWTKLSATVPRDRIQFISIHRSWIARLLGIAAIRIETAGGTSSENAEPSTAVSRRWFLPVIAEKDVPRIMELLRPGIRWSESEYPWQPLSPLAARRLYRTAWLAGVLIAISVAIPLRWWAIPIGIVVGVVGMIIARKRAASMRYAHGDFGLVYRSGMLTKKCSLTFPDKLQAVKIVESPFDRNWKMATLIVDTASAGPADHAIEVSMLDATNARKARDWITSHAQHGR